MTKLENFLKNTKPSKSVLYDFKDVIFELKSKGYSSVKICEYLKSEKVECTSRNLNYWLKRQSPSLKKSVAVANNKSTPKTISNTKEDAKKAVEALECFFVTENEKALK